MKTSGRKHTYSEKLLMNQVAEEFTKKKDQLGKLGAKKAARELRISVPSFYNYAAGSDLPRMEVLKAASEKWGIKWKNIDPSDFLQTANPNSAEQFLLPFLDAVSEENVEVDKIEREGKRVLRLALKIRFIA